MVICASFPRLLRESSQAEPVICWVVGQFEKFAPVLELCRSLEPSAKTKSELGAQRPALPFNSLNI